MNGRQNAESTSLKFCAWNICGLKDKLQDKNILDFILGFDIVWLLETKKYFNVQVPGFVVYQNVSKEGYHRGGIMMLVKYTILDCIVQVDTNTEGQIWIVLEQCGTMKVGGVYIPPEDSPYYDPALYGALAAHTKDFENILVLGDYNARIGVPNIVNKNGDPYHSLDIYYCPKRPTLKRSPFTRTVI